MYASHSSTATRHLFYYTPPATSEIYTLSLHDALPICSKVLRRHARTRGTRAAGDASRPRRYLVFGTSRPRPSLGGPRSWPSPAPTFRAARRRSRRRRCEAPRRRRALRRRRSDPWLAADVRDGSVRQQDRIGRNPGVTFRFSPRPNRAAEIGWRAWSEKAFQEAQVADKPVLLAISAVWCHWCHVMDETSYSDAEVIRLVNERYVPIRVDNDERPDVNRRYNMGGWPSTVFLTPDGEIVHGGTYVPPDAMRSYLGSVADLWSTQRSELAQRVAELREKENEARAPTSGDLSFQIVDQVGSLVRGQYDPQFGGFGREPKFPQPRLLRFLLDEHRRLGYPEIATMRPRTLGAMAGGGMYDHVEGGFFRYSTTRQWEIPHYEKMLEDNAELLSIYAEAHRSFPTAGYDRVVRDVIRWMDAVLWQADKKLWAGSQDADEHYYTLDSQEERAKHQTPFVDRTAYAGWNALAASAYWAAWAATGDEAFDARAHEAMGGAVRRLWDTDSKVLYHSDSDEGRRVVDLLGDVAANLAANLDAYETGLHPGALGGAKVNAMTLRDRLEDPEAGGFFDAPEGTGAEPGRLARREDRKSTRMNSSH